jgi:ABC-type dipeptide/oligopeptide/nickel transport system permease component
MPFFARIGSALLVVLGVCTLVFLLIHLVPGDPVEAMLGESAQPADRAALRNGSKTSYTFSKTTKHAKHAKGTNRQGPL